MRKLFLFVFVLIFCSSISGCAQQKAENNEYTIKRGDPNGIGKWYKGREIARVMGYQGMSWLERPEREKEEHTSLLLKNMNIQTGDAIADIGAGSGYHVFKMAEMNGSGIIYAVDIQEEMLNALRLRKKEDGFGNVEIIKGTEKSVNIPENSVDKILMVDVYHEFNFPREMVLSMKTALKPNGKIYLVEYRGEDKTIPIKEIHKMTEDQAIKEMKAVGMKMEKNIANLPWQHCMIFVKEN